MTDSSAVVVPLSLRKLLATLLVCNFFLICCLFLVFGPGTIFDVGIVAINGLCVVVFVVAAVRQRPRVVITSKGFAVYKLFGEETQKWENIEGPFAVIRIGMAKAVGYKLSERYKEQIGKKSTSYFSGYDAGISGAFKLSARELVELLNVHRRKNMLSLAPEAENSDRPEERVR